MTKVRLIARKALIGPIWLLLLLGVYLGARQLVGNFYEVIPGTLYRSAQVSPASLSHYKKYFGIRTVINLRGANPGADWYDAELKASDELGLTHIDFAMKASRPLPRSRAAELIALMRTAPKPILVHCQAGADRTGLAAALYMAAIGGSDASIPRRQLSLRFGHIGIPFLSAAYPMDESWETLAPWLGATANLTEDKL